MGFVGEGVSETSSWSAASCLMSSSDITGLFLGAVDVSAGGICARLEIDPATVGIGGDFGNFEAISAMCGFLGEVYGFSELA